jgi:hypothetical protein
MTASLHQISPALGVWAQFKVVNWLLCRLMLKNIWPGSQVGLGAYLSVIIFDTAFS